MMQSTCSLKPMYVTMLFSCTLLSFYDQELPCNPEQCVRIVDLFVQAQSSSDAAVGLQQEAMKALDTALQQRANEALTLQYARTTIKAKFVITPTTYSLIHETFYAGVCLTSRTWLQ